MKKLYGNRDSEKVRERELEAGFVTYATLAEEVGPMVLNNTIVEACACNGIEVEQEHGVDYVCVNEEGDTVEEDSEDFCDRVYSDVYQYYIISNYGAEILKAYTDEFVYYIDELDIYLWGVTHVGTSWDYVFTDIEIYKDEA